MRSNESRLRSGKLLCAELSFSSEALSLLSSELGISKDKLKEAALNAGSATDDHSEGAEEVFRSVIAMSAEDRRWFANQLFESGFGQDETD